MSFSSFCVGMVLVLIVFVITFIIGLIFGDDAEDGLGIALILSSIGFGVCLTIVLYQTGIIR